MFSKKSLIQAGLRLLQYFDYALMPRHLALEITQVCNLNCFMCIREYTRYEKGNLSLEQFETILKKLNRLRLIALVGMGETLMNPHIYDMLQIAENKGINVSMVTNGTLLNEKNIKRLTSATKYISVSIDSPSPENYMRIRGADLNNTKSHLKKLKEIRPDIRLGIRAILMKDNVNEITGFVGLAKEVSADEIVFSHVSAYDKELDERHVHYIEGLDLIYAKVREEARKSGIDVYFKPSKPEQIGCLEPWYSIRVSIKGDIYPCSYIYGSDENSRTEYYQGVKIDVPMKRYCMGNIFNDDVHGIWNGRRYQNLRKDVRSVNKCNFSKQELGELRGEIDLEKDFSYCHVCLYRWGCAC